MTSFIRFVPLAGATDEGSLCYLLQIDDIRILLDCGWSDTFDTADLQSLSSIARHVDAVLLTHADLRHVGAYPYAVTKLGLSCPAYATYPVHDLGQMCLYDAYQSKRNAEDFNAFSLQDVDLAFGKVVPLRYSQPLALTGKCKGITITAYNAGHSLGGTIWKIRKDTDEIVYAVDYNHIKERHLNKAVILSDALSRPSILITDCFNALVTQLRRRQRDEILFNTLQQSLSTGANILIPVESATRSLEITYLLESFWSTSPELSRYALVYLSNQSFSVINVAKRMLEWMGEGISSLIAQDRKAPFDFQHVNLLHKLKELEKFRGPKVVIATLPSLDCGFARELFLTWSSSQENTIILPDRGPPGSMARRLFDEWGSFQRQDALANVSIDIPLELSRSVELEGEELAEYVAKEAARKEKEAAEEALRTRNMMEDDESDLSEEEEDVELQGKSTSNQFDVYVKDTVRSTGYFKQAQSFKMFPCVEPRRRVDDYGEVIDPTLFSAGELPDADDPSEAIPMPQAVSPATKIEAGPPSKYITDSVVVNVRCRVIYIDFEGRIDGRSTKEILSQLAPRKLVLIHGTEEAIKSMESFVLEHNALTNDVFCPKKDEWINVSIATNVYQIKLTDSLVTSLNMEKVDDYEIAYISGFIKMADTAPAVLKENEDNDMDMDKKPSSVSSNIPTLDLLPMEYHLSRVPVIVGDVRLSEFRRAVVDQGFDAEFVAGTLLVNKSVVVRRGQGGRLMLEGPMGSDYFRLRTLLYAEHAVVY